MRDTPLMLVELSVVEQRYQAVLAVIRDGVPVVEVSRRLEVSRQAVHRWLRWCQRQGLGGLADLSHRPARCSHQMPASVEAQVLERVGVDPLPSRSGIYRLLRHMNRIDPDARKHRSKKFRLWERGPAARAAPARWTRPRPRHRGTYGATGCCPVGYAPA